MKRFWKEAATVEEQGGWGVQLDGRTLRTPARAALIVPTAKLAGAIADEWRDAPEEANPREMPLTGLANAAIDRVAPDPAAFAAGIAKYSEGDLTCYRSEGPQQLASRQQQSWDVLLGWARRRFDVDFRITCGLLHVPQPEATVERLSHAVHALDVFQLATLSPMVTISGSLVAALSVLEHAFTAESAWAAVSIDEQWQLEQWGSDAEAELALENRRKDFLVAARFLELLEQD
ncbi:MAG: ATP12 family protein [Sphingomicrobium sp.]